METINNNNTNECIEQAVRELETAIADQKAFKKENKSVFDENRMHTKTVNTLKQTLRGLMAEKGITTVTVSNTEVELKKDRKMKHNLELLEETMENGGSFADYADQVSEDAEKVVTRRAGGKKRKIEDTNN